MSGNVGHARPGPSVSFLGERWVGNRVVFLGLSEEWPWVIRRVVDSHLLSIPTR